MEKDSTWYYLSAFTAMRPMNSWWLSAYFVGEVTLVAMVLIIMWSWLKIIRNTRCPWIQWVITNSHICKTIIIRNNRDTLTLNTLQTLNMLSNNKWDQIRTKSMGHRSFDFIILISNKLGYNVEWNVLILSYFRYHKI